MAAPLRVQVCCAPTQREHQGRQVTYYCSKSTHPRGFDHEAVTATGTITWRAPWPT